MAAPLRFVPFFQDYLWGGRNLATRLGKAIPAEGVWAESWEIIDHPHHQSIVASGPMARKTLTELAGDSPEWLLGPNLKSLPLLLKYLDCQNVLSIQVHPDDHYAQKLTPPDLGKTEAWYIVDAQPGAVLYAGLKHGVSRTDLHQALQAGAVEPLLHVITPKPGDCIFIPAGTVHALGAGLLVAEIQQASNTTFRLHDWNRVGADGKLRPLHIEQALEVTDFASGPRPIQTPLPTSQPGRQRLVECDKFNLDLISGDDLTGANSISIGNDDAFHLLTAPNGGVVLEGEGFCEMLRVGESILLPAALKKCSASVAGGAVLLDMHAPS